MMKRMLSGIVAMVMLLSAVVSAHAAEPEFLNELYTNYTGEYSVSVTFESSDDIAALLDELEMSEEISMFVDVKSLLKTLLTVDAKMILQADITRDMKKAEISLVSESEHSIDVNQNLNIGLNSKTGMWIRMDLSAKTPVLEVIYSYPMLAKYMRIDAFELLDSEEEKEQLLSSLNSIFNAQLMREMQDFSAELIKKYAQIYMSGKSWIIDLDNDGLCAMIDEFLPFAMEKLFPLMGELTGAGEGADMSLYTEQLPSFEGLKLLGDEGITCIYSFSGSKLSSARMMGDIEIDLSGIFTMFSGEEWMYQAQGLLDFKVTTSVRMTKVGATNVEFPKLTEENSFDIADTMAEPEPEDGNEYTEEIPEYPYFYIDVYTDKVYTVNGELFVPLRATLNAAYEDTCAIEYDRGIITLKSDYFHNFDEIMLSVGSDKVYAAGNEYTVGKVFVVDGVSYVNVSFFEDVLGWELMNAMYDILNKEYNYSFWAE